MFAGKHKVEFKHPIFKSVVEIIVENVIVFTEAEMALSLELNKPNGIFDTTPSEELLDKNDYNRYWDIQQNFHRL